MSVRKHINKRLKLLRESVRKKKEVKIPGNTSSNMSSSVSERRGPNITEEGVKPSSSMKSVQNVLVLAWGRVVEGAVVGRLGKLPILGISPRFTAWKERKCNKDCHYNKILKGK